MTLFSILRWLRNPERRAVQALQQLDDHLLRDIGVVRSAIAAAARETR